MVVVEKIFFQTNGFINNNAHLISYNLHNYNIFYYIMGVNQNSKHTLPLMKRVLITPRRSRTVPIRTNSNRRRASAVATTSRTRPSQTTRKSSRKSTPPVNNSIKSMKNFINSEHRLQFPRTREKGKKRTLSLNH